MVLIAAAIGIGWVVSPVISLVINKIETNIEKKYFKNSETGKYFKEMKTSLGEILSIMARVEKQRIEKHEDAKLVQEIKDAVYDAEDVVNDFEYNLLDEEKSVEQQKIESGAAASSSSFIQGAMSVYEEFTEKGKELSEYLDWPILGDGEFKKKVKEVSESLVRAKASAQILLQLMNINTSSSLKSFKQENESPTSSQITEEIIGRKEERERLINLLLEKNEGPPTIIQIDGQGGIGKSTLARLVYNDPKVTDYFDQPMWLYVSENFDMIKLTKEMLNHVSPNFNTEITNFGLLQTELRKELASKKILLVLDDVWYVKDDNKKSSYEEGWLQFLAPLKNAKAGSKIIATAREGVVDRIWESFGSVKTISLGGLNADDSWSLLKLKAFGRREVHNPQNLEQIGKELVKNLKGLPLAIRVVGTELRGESDTEEWERILNDNALDKSDIKGILLRSYEHLAEHLRRCFAYCSLFPKGYYLKPDRLVQMWIVQGFVHPQERKSSDKIGKSYFNELIDRSFIQVIKQGDKKYYVMHDLMNDLACHVSQDECYILKEGDAMEKLGSIRHLSVTTTKAYHHLIKNIHGLDKLRTLILPSDSCFRTTVIWYAFSIKLKNIRVLHIEWRFKMLPDIGECKQLRYLCFRNCWHKLASDAFNKLHLLTVLFIRKNDNRLLKGHYTNLSLPQSICNMSRLEFIDSSKSFKMELGGWVQLQRLWRGGAAFFIVQEKKGWELAHLRDFSNIKGMLSIYRLENVASKEEAIEAQLDSKEHVTKFMLYWYNSTSIGESNKHNEVLEALRPHPNIERLSIDGFPGDKWPSWLESNWLSRMTYISIKGGSRFKRLPALGHLSQLRKVKIRGKATMSGIGDEFYDEYLKPLGKWEVRGTTTVSKIGDEFYGNGTFPSLEELQILGMEGLEEWSSPCGVQSFPKLRRLVLAECPDLFSLPGMESFSSLQSVHIMDCPKIKSLPKLPSLLEIIMI